MVVVNDWFYDNFGVCAAPGRWHSQGLTRLQVRQASTIGLLLSEECYGRVAEWFKAPVLKFHFGPYRFVLKAAESPVE
jgi:hypothetical protein